MLLRCMYLVLYLAKQYLYTQGCKSFFEFQKNLTIKRAVEHELGIIDEVVNRIFKGRTRL